MRVANQMTRDLAEQNSTTKSDARPKGQLWSRNAQISHRARVESSSTRSSFATDHPRPVPLAVVSLDGGWGQWETRRSTHARQQSDDEAFGCLERVTVTAAVHPCLVETHHTHTPRPLEGGREGGRERGRGREGRDGGGGEGRGEGEWREAERRGRQREEAAVESEGGKGIREGEGVVGSEGGMGVRMRRESEGRGTR